MIVYVELHALPEGESRYRPVADLTVRADGSYTLNDPDGHFSFEVPILMAVAPDAAHSLTFDEDRQVWARNLDRALRTPYLVPQVTEYFETDKADRVLPGAGTYQAAMSVDLEVKADPQGGCNIRHVAELTVGSDGSHTLDDRWGYFDLAAGVEVPVAGGGVVTVAFDEAPQLWARAMSQVMARPGEVVVYSNERYETSMAGWGQLA